MEKPSIAMKMYVFFRFWNAFTFSELERFLLFKPNGWSFSLKGVWERQSFFCAILGEVKKATWALTETVGSQAKYTPKNLFVFALLIEGVEHFFREIHVATNK